MKYYFIANPISNNGKAVKKIEILKNELSNCNIDYELILTEYQHHAAEIVKELADNGEFIRVYACGGDGTLFDVVNGAFGYKNVEVGSIPFGSANDFIKSFNNIDCFSNIQNQINGKTLEIDLIKLNDKYSINIASVGFDAYVVNNKNNMKLFSGNISYIMSVFKTFIFNMSNHFKITLDDNEYFEDDYMFVVSANGRFYGGSFNPTPKAILNDGLIDVILLNKVNRLKVVTLLKKYMNGTHEKVKNLCSSHQAKRVTVESEKAIPVNLDGEVFKMKKATFEIVLKGIRFVVPTGVSLENSSIEL